MPMIIMAMIASGCDDRSAKTAERAGAVIISSSNAGIAITPGIVEDVSTNGKRYDQAAWMHNPPQESFDYVNHPMHPDRAYRPGAYGKVKDAPMFVCWREWDGEIGSGLL